MSELADFAQSLFDGGMNCAESTIFSISKFLGYNSEIIPRMSTGFGGGFSRTKNICGAVTGGIMGIGLIFGRDEAKGDKEICYRKTQEFIDSFLAQFGSLKCFELSGVDFNTPEGEKLYKGKVHRECCVHLVRFAVEKVSSMKEG